MRGECVKAHETQAQKTARVLKILRHCWEDNCDLWAFGKSPVTCPWETICLFCQALNIYVFHFHFHLSRPTLDTLGRMSFYSCLYLSPCLDALGLITLDALGRIFLHHLSRLTLDTLGPMFLCLSPCPRYSWFTLVTLASTCYTCLHLSPFLLRLSPLASHLCRPTLDRLGRMLLSLVSTCLSASLLRCSWRDDFTLVSLLASFLLHLSSTCLEYT